MSLQELLWVSVKITHSNYHELQELVDEHLEGIPWHVNDLTQALTLHSIGLTNKEIQLSLY